MRVTVELQNLGDAEMCREIIARIEHAFSDKAGEWRVSIAESCASENWEMKVVGPNGFERSIQAMNASRQLHFPVRWPKCVTLPTRTAASTSICFALEIRRRNRYTVTLDSESCGQNTNQRLARS